MRFKCPIYLSFNLPDEILNVNREFYFHIEKDIVDHLNGLS